MCLEFRPQCTVGCHWRKNHGWPVRFQWSSSGLPVVFHCVPIMQINTGSRLGDHWVLASASVVPVASQCTCGSSGLPMWSVQWYPSVVTESVLEVIRSDHFRACSPLCIQLVWWSLRIQMPCSNIAIRLTRRSASLLIYQRTMRAYHTIRYTSWSTSHTGEP